MQYRQGDVFIERVRKLPHKRRKLQAESRIVLAYGEVTGHAHAVLGTDIDVYEAPDGTLYLRVGSEAEVVHEEHGTIGLGRGTYRVGRQREYTPQEIRQVAD